jgi:hypothetical protein
MNTNSKKTRGTRTKGLFCALVGTVALLALLTPAAALGVPTLDVTSSHVPVSDPVPAGTHARYEVAVSNVGDAEASGVTTIHFSVPAALEVASVTDQAATSPTVGAQLWNDCSIAADRQSVSCGGIDALGLLEGPYGISPGSEACVDLIGETCRFIVTVKVDPGAAPGPYSPTVQACNASATPTCSNAPNDSIEVIPFDFKLVEFDGEVLDELGDPVTQAGAHPYSAATRFSFFSARDEKGFDYVIDELKDASVRLPAGLVGNPQAYPTCTQEQLTSGQNPECPPESQLGTVHLDFTDSSGFGNPVEGVYNMQVPHGLPALFAFNYLGNVTQVYAELRTGDDYGVTVTSKNAPQTIGIEGIEVELWGVPADPSHDSDRFRPGTDLRGTSSSAPLKPFISLPTSCVGPVETFLDVRSWLGASDSASFLSHDNTEPVPNPVGNDGCNAVPFAPTLQARPTTNVADSPSGLDVDLHIPQSEDPEGIATAHLKDTTVTLPQGLVVNPASANGLDGCSPAEIDLKGKGPANCPNASRIASVQVETPLLEKPMPGSVYLADPHQNPFNSLLALYIVVDDAKTGIVVKLAGEVKTDPSTGRISATFEDNPQVPFEDFKLKFFGGAGGSLRTPATCGQYTTTSSLTPWTAPEGQTVTQSDTWAIEQGPGGNCATSPGALPNAPFFDAGAVSPLAGKYSPFVVRLRREDGSQNFAALDLSPPPGLTAKLIGTPTCPDSALATAAAKSGKEEIASPSCPAASEVGDVVAGAGAGPAPYYAHGKAYLTGPYKGAPLSMAIITPATAGPFDLGTIVVRTALHVDSKTTRLTAVSDPIPTILQGIPLDVRTIDVAIDKPEFSLNPTSCNEMAVNGRLLSTLGQIANLASRFQLGECGRLSFKPKLTLSLKGGTTRGKHPALTAILMPGANNANLAAISVALPRSEFLDQAHIGTVCTRVQFAADQCPAASIYGKATVTTPLLDYPLVGNVYLRSSDNTLPDLVPDLRGPAYQPLRVEAAGRTDSIKGGIRNTFDFVPDAPFTKLTLELPGGRKGLLINSKNICKGINRATVKATAHNGAQVTLRPVLKAPCKKKQRKGAKRRSRSAR